jgi:hypothetical protein
MLPPIFHCDWLLRFLLNIQLHKKITMNTTNIMYKKIQLENQKNSECK